IASTVEYHLGNPFFLRTLGNTASDFPGGGNVAARSLVCLRTLDGAGGDQGTAVQVVHYLDVDMVQRAVNAQPGALGRSEHLLADAVMHPQARLVFRALRNHCPNQLSWRH